MGLLSRMFGDDEVIATATKGAYNGLDKAFYTGEEKADYFLNLLNAYDAFKIVQRVIAFMLLGAYVGTWVLVVLMYVISGLIPITFGMGLEEINPTILATLMSNEEIIQYSYAERLKATAESLAAANYDTLSTSTALVSAFYFGGGALEGVIGKIKGKKVEKTAYQKPE